MEKGVRKIIFLFCLIFFIVVAPGMVLYSQGYRINWEAKKISQTGGLFLKVWPKQVEIYLDSRLKKKTDFFFGSALIENLLPKKYNVLIKKEGFHPWEKTLSIEEKKVQLAENIILFSQNPSLNTLSQNVEKFWFLIDEKQVILKELKETGGWALKIYDLGKGVKGHLIEDKDIYPGADLITLKSEDSKKILLEVGIKESLKSYVLEIDKNPPVLIEKKEELFLPEDVLTYQEFNGEVYYLDNSGHLFKTDRAFDSKTRISKIPISILPETEYQIEKFADFIFIQEGQILYFLNPETKSFEKFFENLKGLALSPDYKKLAYFSDYEIWILFLEEKNQPLFKKEGERLFLFRLSEKINQVIWLNSDYLVLTTANNVKISEIDERDRINIVNFAQVENPEVFFNKTNKKLYILSQETLYRSENLLP